MDTGKEEEEDEGVVPMNTDPDNVEAKSMFSVCSRSVWLKSISFLFCFVL